MGQHTTGEEREVPGPLKDLDAAALQARMEKAQGDPIEEKSGFGQTPLGCFRQINWYAGLPDVSFG